MFDTLKLVFDTFGKDLMVPVMIFIICMIFKAPAKKAFSSAVLVGVGLKGMTFITTEFGAVLSPLVQQLIATTGLNLKALDIGWQAVASVAYSTDIGMMFIGVGLLFQIILWLVKWTDIFMPSDLWNNYSIIVWGSMFFAIKENLAVAFVLMLFINVVTLLIADAGIGKEDIDAMLLYRHFDAKALDENSAAVRSSRLAYAMAGVTAEDIDACEFYDCFTYTVEATLRDYGFFKPENVREFITREKIGPGGDLPVNTSGGMLSEGYFMGLTPVSEAVMQLRGECGDRQLGVYPGTKKPELIMCSDNGAVFQSNSALILERGDF